MRVPLRPTRDVLVSTRAVLLTALKDKPVDLERPERARILQLRIDEITAVLDQRFQGEESYAVS